MTHTPLYKFSITDGRVLQYRRNTNLQIARLHSFSHNRPDNDYLNSGIIGIYKNLLACSNQDATLLIIDIFTRKKSLLQTPKTRLNTLSFLDKNTLLSISVDGLVRVYNLKTLHGSNVTNPSLVALLKESSELDLETLSSSVLRPLIESNSFTQVFGLINENPWLRGTLEHTELEHIYRDAFERAIEALRDNNINRAHNLLSAFKNVDSKKEEIAKLFVDFKHFERFQLHITEQNYSIAYALSSKHPLLNLTPEFQKLEDIFTHKMKLAYEQMLMERKDEARGTLSKYMTILSKRDEIKKLLNAEYDYKIDSDTKENLALESEKLLLAYEKNSFKECYELIDTYSIDNLELVEFLEKHWVKLMIESEDYALQGNIKAIKKTLGKLITIKTRTDKIGDLLRVAFQSKIRTLQETKSINGAENIIYSYIDIFGTDVEIKEIMKEYEKVSRKTLAITQGERTLRDDWLNAALIVEL